MKALKTPYCKVTIVILYYHEATSQLFTHGFIFRNCFVIAALVPQFSELSTFIISVVIKHFQTMRKKEKAAPKAE